MTDFMHQNILKHEFLQRFAGPRNDRRHIVVRRDVRAEIFKREAKRWIKSALNQPFARWLFVQRDAIRGFVAAESQAIRRTLRQTCERDLFQTVSG